MSSFLECGGDEPSFCSEDFLPSVNVACSLDSRSFSFIELIACLKALNCSAGILVPAFVKPVYLSDLTNSLIVSPILPPKSSILITMSVSGFFGIRSMSFSIFRKTGFSI